MGDVGHPLGLTCSPHHRPPQIVRSLTRLGLGVMCIIPVSQVVPHFTAASRRVPHVTRSLLIRGVHNRRSFTNSQRHESQETCTESRVGARPVRAITRPPQGVPLGTVGAHSATCLTRPAWICSLHHARDPIGGPQHFSLLTRSARLAPQPAGRHRCQSPRARSSWSLLLTSVGDPEAVLLAAGCYSVIPPLFSVFSAPLQESSGI